MTPIGRRRRVATTIAIPAAARIAQGIAPSHPGTAGLRAAADKLIAPGLALDSTPLDALAKSESRTNLEIVQAAGIKLN